MANIISTLLITIYLLLQLDIYIPYHILIPIVLKCNIKNIHIEQQNLSLAVMPQLTHTANY